MENIYSIKKSLIYSTLYAKIVPQNIYQYKSLEVSDPQILKLNQWTLSLNPKLNNPK